MLVGVHTHATLINLLQVADYLCMNDFQETILRLLVARLASFDILYADFVRIVGLNCVKGIFAAVV